MTAKEADRVQRLPHVAMFPAATNFQCSKIMHSQDGVLGRCLCQLYLPDAEGHVTGSAGAKRLVQ